MAYRHTAPAGLRTSRGGFRLEKHRHIFEQFATFDNMYVQDAYAAGEIDLDYALSVITSYRGLFKDVTSDAFLEKMLDEFVLSRPALEA